MTDQERITLGMPSMDEEMKSAALTALSEERLVLGESVIRFEQEFARYCGSDYAISVSSGSAALQLSVNIAGVPSLVLKWSSGAGTSPLVANGVVFIARSGLISAFDATSGSLLWSDNRVGPIHWESPIVVKGVVYITDQSGKLTAFSIP